MNYVQTVLDLPVDKVFDYAVPEHLREEIEIGKRVWVEFRNKKTVAYIVGLLKESKLAKVKQIKKVIDSQPIITSSLLSLAKWLSEYYFCSWGEALAMTLPPGLRRGQKKTRPTLLAPTRCKWVKGEVGGLSPEQCLAADKIVRAIKQAQPQTFLVYEQPQERIKIYLRIIEHILKQNKGVIVLVPEISLAPRIIARFISHFGEIIAEYHSQLSSRQQFQEWQRIKKGEAKIVIGSRSAVFSPLKDLGLIIVDEEQDNSYKEESIPRYNARNVAIKRAEIEKAIVVLGSAIPCLESYYNAESKKYQLLKLRAKSDNISPNARVIDRNREDFSVSPLLRTKIEEHLQKEERVVVYEKLGKERRVEGESFSKLGLIGVVSADNILNFPNFLASERTFGLLSQIVKEAQKEKAELIIQTYNPAHFSITAAVKQNYEDFYKEEITYRQELNYPPFVHFINIILKGENEQRLKKRIMELSEDLRKEFGEEKILGPAHFSDYWYVALKTKNVLKTNQSLKRVLADFNRRRADKRVIVDVDPLFFF